jgi:hypothetical protein
MSEPTVPTTTPNRRRRRDFRVPKFNHNEDKISAVLGVSAERAEELHQHVNDVLTAPNQNNIMEDFIEVLDRFKPTNTQELMLVCFVTGTAVGQIQIQARLRHERMMEQMMGGGGDGMQALMQMLQGR